MKFIESLPACPVETTLMLIGDNGKSSFCVISCLAKSVLVNCVILLAIYPKRF